MSGIMKPQVLICDDDSHIREVISFALERAGFDVSIACDGKQALAQFASAKPDLIILDIGMPEMDGLDVCRELRKTSDVPILFLSAREDEIDRVLGLEIGGDDYVTKPFSPRELIARVKVILKRSAAKAPAVVSSENMSHGKLSLDGAAHRATFASEGLDVTALEFAILKTFLTQKNRAFTRDQIMNAAYASNIHVSDRTIDSHIRNIRAKLASRGCASVIDTVHGIGFRLGTCETNA